MKRLNLLAVALTLLILGARQVTAKEYPLSAAYLTQHVSIVFRNAPPAVVLDSISKQTGAAFTPLPEIEGRKLSLALEKLSLREILDILTQHEYLEFTETGPGRFTVSRSRDILALPINLNLRKAGLPEVLTELSRQTGVAFSSSDYLGDIVVNVAFVDYPLGSFLKRVAKRYKVRFSRNGTTNEFVVSR